jgi:2-dehydro-3-deoxyphosphogalactonate aldolase
MLDLRTALAKCPVIAILRRIQPHEVDAVGDALVEAGIVVIEVPLNSPEPLESVQRLATRHGSHALIGAGTVVEVADVARVAAAGGRLIVAPNFDGDVVRAAKAAGLFTAPGVMTPSEGFAALKAGADALKLFPAEMIPAAAIKAWRAVFPRDTLLIAVGGVGVDNLKVYGDAGASGFGIGSTLYQPGRSAAEVRRLARSLVDAARI